MPQSAIHVPPPESPSLPLGGNGASATPLLDLLGPLPLRERAIVRDALEPVAFAAGDSLFRAGAAGECCFLIAAGTVCIVPGDAVPSARNERVTRGPSTIVGELSLLDRRPHLAC